MFAAFVGPFILITGLLTVWAGISHAARPLERKLATMRSLSVSSMFAIVSGLCGGLVNTLVQVAEHPEGEGIEALVRLAAAGFAESVAAPMLGFALLAVAWLGATVGTRKMLLADSVSGDSFGRD